MNSDFGEGEVPFPLTSDVKSREKIEVELLLQAIYRMYGYDFRNYAYDSIYRRIRHGMQSIGEEQISALIPQVLHNPARMQELLRYFVVGVTEMFRDPEMFLSFRKKVIPYLRTYPHIRIWHAGCSTGEEVLSMAILLQEEGLYDRARIYATDINEDALETAQNGIYPLRNMKVNTQNYIRAGGTKDFSDYYMARKESVIFQSSLYRNIVFARHNLVTDQSFNEFNVILCRNVLIYFNRELQNRVHQLFHESLAMLGFLVLGDKESMLFNSHTQSYESIDFNEKLYKKIK
ncbi:protein-glutamate O-methyltransferase CheR [Neobacillus mesonae]|nr:protein-glutamate O-methyltransferase CheR [Neobacillus mesonae]